MKRRFTRLLSQSALGLSLVAGPAWSQDASEKPRSEAPRAEAPARPDEVLSPRLRSAMSKRDAFGAPKSPTICTNCD